MSRLVKLRKLLIDRVDLVRRGANQDAHIVLFKADEDEIEKGKQKNMDELKKQLEDLQKAFDAQKAQLEKAQSDLTAAQTEVTKAQSEVTKAQGEVADLKKAATTVAKSEEEQEQEFLKSMPEGFRKRYEAQQADLKKAAEEKAVLIAKAQEADFKKAAGQELSHLKGDEAAKVTVLKALSKLTADEQKSVMEVLKAANEVIKTSGLFEERGTGGSHEGGSAEEQLNAIAKSLLDKKEVATLGDGLVKAGKANPELYREYVAERRSKN